VHVIQHGLALLISKWAKAAARIQRSAPRREFVPTVECAETSYELPCQQWADEAEIAPVGSLSLANATGRKNRSMHRGADESRRLQGRRGGESGVQQPAGHAVWRWL
jgi:hypothetical protein